MESMFGEFVFIVILILSKHPPTTHTLKKYLPKITKKYPESNEYNWITEFEGI